MMTAHGAIQDAVEAMKLGAYDYLLKPFDLEELNLTIEKMLHLQTLAMENLILKDGFHHPQYENLLGVPAMVSCLKPLSMAQTAATVPGKPARQKGGPCHPCPKPPMLCSLHCRQLRGLHRPTVGERALWP
jgi:hypothetical protein